jgi:hypothetical protein
MVVMALAMLANKMMQARRASVWLLISAES